MTFRLDFQFPGFAILTVHDALNEQIAPFHG